MGLRGRCPRAARLEDNFGWPSSVTKVVASTSPVAGNQWGSPVDIGHLFEEAAATALQSAWRGRVVRRDLVYEAASTMLQSAWYDTPNGRREDIDEVPEQMPQLKRKDFDKRMLLPQFAGEIKPAGLQLRQELSTAWDGNSPRHLGGAMRGDPFATRHMLSRPPPEAWLPADSPGNLEASFGREPSFGHDRDPLLADGFDSPRTEIRSPAPLPPDLPTPPRPPPPLDPSIRMVLQGIGNNELRREDLPHAGDFGARYAGPPPPRRRREEVTRIGAEDDQLFDRIDTNRDGLISRREYESAVNSGILNEDDYAASIAPSSSSRAPVRDNFAEDEARKRSDFLENRIDVEEQRIREDEQSQNYVSNWKEARLLEEKRFEAERAQVEDDRRREDQWWEDQRREEVARQEEKKRREEEERREFEDARERRQAELLRIKGWYRDKEEERAEKRELRERVKGEYRHAEEARKQAEDAKRQADEAKKQAEEAKRQVDENKRQEEKLREERMREQERIEEERRESRRREAQLEKQMETKKIEEAQLSAKIQEERRREEELERQRREERRRDEEKQDEKRREARRKEEEQYQQRFQEDRRREEERIKEEFKDYERKLKDKAQALEERRHEEEEAKQRMEKMKEELRREEEQRLEKLRKEEMRLEERRQEEEEARQRELKLREEVRLAEEKRLNELKKEEKKLEDIRRQDEERRREEEERLLEEEERLEELRQQEEQRREEARKEEKQWEERRRQDEIRRQDELRLDELKREERRIEEKMQYEEWKLEQRTLEDSWRRERDEEERKRKESEERLRDEELQYLETRSFQDESDELDSAGIGSRRSPGGHDEYRLRRLEEELAEEEERNRLRAIQLARNEVETKLREERVIAAEDIANRKLEDFKEEELKVRRRQQELAAEQKRREHHLEKIREMERDVDRREAELRQREQQLRNMEQEALHRSHGLKHLEQKARQREKDLEMIEEGYAEKAVDSDLAQRRLAIREAELEACAKDIAERELELRERESKITAFREQSLFERQTLELRARELEGHIDELEILEQDALLQAAFRAWKHVKVAADMEKDKKVKHVVVEKELQRRQKPIDDAEVHSRRSSSASNQESASLLYDPVLPPLTLVSDEFEALPRVQPLPRSPLRSYRSDSGSNDLEEAPSSSPGPGQRFPDGTAWVIDTSDWPEPEDEPKARFDPDRSRREFEIAKRKMELHMQAQAERERRIQRKLDKERKNREKLWQGPTHIQAREHEWKQPTHSPKDQPRTATATRGPPPRHEQRGDALRPKVASKGVPSANLIAPSGIPASPAFGTDIPSPQTPKATPSKRAVRGKGLARSTTPTRQQRPIASAKASNARSVSPGPRLAGGHGSWRGGIKIGREDTAVPGNGRKSSFVDEMDDELLWAQPPPSVHASRLGSNEEQVSSTSRASSSRFGPRDFADASRFAASSDTTRSSPQLREEARSPQGAKASQANRTASRPTQEPPAVTTSARGVSARSASGPDSEIDDARPWWAKAYPNTRAVTQDSMRR